MSYCRFGPDSDVYIYANGEKLGCSGCKLVAWSDDSDPYLTHAEMKRHLEQHVAAGHKVPQYAFDRINYELKKAETVFGRKLDPDQLSPGEWN